ncbi:hypothetical protein [Marinimicrobium alkaliphilum]|uniref:hypothetical protein n=1 Tax=Marinimicrobium alkaliphilum TaxID=2202654 RepID=UPI000DBA7F14|nr:hypothetical protein [Marinimicrobium alkaliphilum]
MIGLWLLGLASLVLPAYAHYRLPTHTSYPSALWITRLFLLGLGLGVAWVTSFRYFAHLDDAARLPLLLFGFGIAHFPAAGVLYLKQWRRNDLRRTQNPPD